MSNLKPTSSSPASINKQLSTKILVKGQKTLKPLLFNSTKTTVKDPLTPLLFSLFPIDFDLTANLCYNRE